MKFVSQKTESIPASAIRKMYNLAAGLPDVVSFALGEPDFDTPKHIVEAGMAALQKGDTHYTPNMGIIPLREAISEDYKKRNLNYSKDEIIITSGAVQALMLSMVTFLDPGDEIIISNPHWTNYNGIALEVGAVPVQVEVREENDFMFDINDLRKAVTGKTKMLLLNSPSNPTGGVAGRENLQAIADLAKEKDILVMTDEIYKHLIYGNEPYVSIAELDGMRERTIIVDGFSKAYAMTGWRVGYAAGPAELVAAMAKMQENVVSCVSGAVQMAAVAAIKGSFEPVKEMLAEYDKRKRIVIDGLNAMDKISCKEPKGAFYAFANISQTGLSSEDFAIRLLNEKKVVVAPGTAFGSKGEGFIRLSYATSEENIREGLKRMKEFVDSL